MKNKCAICNGSATILGNRRKLANDEVICQKCLSRAKTLTIKQITRLKKVTSDEIRESISASVGSEVLDFNADETIGKVEIDNNNKKLLIPGARGSVTIINFEDIESFDLIEDGESITKGGIKRAFVGGALFGGAGAIVGAMTASKKKEYCNSMTIKITEKDKTKPDVYIPYINKKTKVDSSDYSHSATMAGFMINKLQEICN